MMATPSGWFFWAVLSACFAALTAIFAKIGIQGVDSDFATLIRTVIIVLVLAAFVGYAGKWSDPRALSPRTLLFLSLSALLGGSFRWEGFASTQDTANHLVGAMLMGVGGVCALGCTVGQGLSGVSTLAIGSFIALASIISGAVLALYYQVWRIARSP